MLSGRGAGRAHAVPPECVLRWPPGLCPPRGQGARSGEVQWMRQGGGHSSCPPTTVIPPPLLTFSLALLPPPGSPRTHPFIGHSVGGHLPSTLGASDIEPTVGGPPGSCGTGWPSAFPLHILRTTCSPGGSQDFSPGHLCTECPAARAAGQVPFTSALPLRSAKNWRTHFLKNTLLLSSKR